jgi:hypothetical protein
MIKVSIHNNKDGRNFGAKFATQELADNWIAQERVNQSWGKVERWLPEDRLESNNIADAISSEVRGDVPEDGQTDNRKTWYKFPDDFTIVQTDITAERNIELAREAAQKQAIIDLASIPSIIPANQVSLYLNKIVEAMGLK